MFRGEYLNEDTEQTEAGWRFYPKKKGGKIDANDIVKQLFEEGMSGNLYAVLIKIPEEFPAEDLEYVDVYDAGDAARILAGWEHMKLVKE